jgi:hypothetical protein
MINLQKLVSVFLIASIVFSSLLFLEPAQAVSVSGIISQDTTWTRENSPYMLTDDVVVSNGVTLTIQPGVTVLVGDHVLQIYGTLKAQGTSDTVIVFSTSNPNAKIVFTDSTDWDEQTGAGCIIENVFSSTPIIIEDCSVKISNSYFSNINGVIVSIKGGSSSILNNVFKITSDDCIQVDADAAVEISFNLITGQGAGYGIYTEGSAYIYGNNITNCWSGIYAKGTSIIAHNVIMNNRNDGIRSDNSISTIQENVLADNYCGISCTGNIQGNTIAYNLEAGIWGPLSSATIKQNNIYDNYQNVHLTENYTIEAGNNWWGTTSAAAINQTIWDHKSDPVNLGTLNFIPYLTQPNPSAPSIPEYIEIPDPPETPLSTPTPSATPTASATPTVTVTPDETPTATTSTPDQTQPDSESAAPSIFDLYSFTDILGVAVIVVAVMAALTIIVFINKKYGKT